MFLTLLFLGGLAGCNTPQFEAGQVLLDEVEPSSWESTDERSDGSGGFPVIREYIVPSEEADVETLDIPADYRGSDHSIYGRSIRGLIAIGRWEGPSIVDPSKPCSLALFKSGTRNSDGTVYVELYAYCEAGD